ncbi:MAG: hypothetical protein GY943_05270 [Chloroflexi bacterium]|nr:hypothetical protein [Chloroflexota bacterium]
MNTEYEKPAEGNKVPAVGDMTALLERLTARADNAYVQYMNNCMRDECLGWVAKVERGGFGRKELQAHEDAAEQLGRHRALHEAVKLIREAF